MDCHVCKKKIKTTVTKEFVFEDIETNTRALWMVLPMFVVTPVDEARTVVHKQNLDILDFDANEISLPIENGTVSWHVSAVVCLHSQTPRSGHYTACRRVPGSERQFVEVNDETVIHNIVNHVNFKDTKNTYMLLLN